MVTITKEQIESVARLMTKVQRHAIAHNIPNVVDEIQPVKDMLWELLNQTDAPKAIKLDPTTPVQKTAIEALEILNQSIEYRLKNFHRELVLVPKVITIEDVTDKMVDEMIETVNILHPDWAWENVYIGEVVVASVNAYVNGVKP